MGRSMINLLTEFRTRNGLPSSGAIGGTNATLNQLAGLLRELVEDLPQEARFSVDLKRATFTTLAAEDQGTIASIIGGANAAAYFVNETFWDTTNRLPLLGPASAEEWEMLHGMPIGSPRFTYRIFNNHLYLYPAPAAPLPVIAFEYGSLWLFTDSTGVPKEFLTADSDLCLLPDTLLMAGLKWKWKVEKGLPSNEAEKAYYNTLNNYLAKDGTKRRVKVDYGQPSAEPRIVIPAGNWLQ